MGTHSENPEMSRLIASRFLQDIPVYLSDRWPQEHQHTESALMHGVPLRFVWR